MSQELSRLLIEFYERFNNWEHEVVADTGLTPAQVHAVEIIGHMEAPKMNALAKKLGVTMGSLTVMIDRLEKLKLAKRQRNPKDRRSYEIVLMKKGQKLFAEHERKHNHLTNELCSCFSEAEEAEFVTLLNKMIGQF